MSTLWTPGGEVPIGRKPPDPTPDAPHGSTADTAASGPSSPSDTSGPSDPSGPSGPSDPVEEARSLNLDDLTPEERERAEQAIRDMAETRERLLSVPASMVVANHAMGLYELAALHLSNQPPNFVEATVAIDALGALVDGMAGRLGEPERNLQEGLDQIRMAYVSLKQKAAASDASEDGNR